MEKRKKELFKLDGREERNDVILYRTVGFRTDFKNGLKLLSDTINTFCVRI